MAESTSEIGGDHHEFIVSSAVGDSFWYLPEILYSLCPWKDDMDQSKVERSFTWEEEGPWSDWEIECDSRCSGDNFDVTVKIDVSKDKGGKYEYTVNYADLCYAVTKACTAVLKKYGLLGYCKAAWYSGINLRKLIILKAYALQCREVVTYRAADQEGEVSDINKELELLLFDM